MPPGQPVHRCAGECGRLRPCREHAGAWYCRECNPAYPPSSADGARQRPYSAARDVATDGGTDR